ncbi:MAG: patatin-like phospholipase family protein [Candidatus Paceibacterota bacterium]|jgi:NTE family protein
MTIKRALVLSGGGSKGAYQVGALKALTEAGRQWNTVHGVSVGALNGGWLAMHKPEEQASSIEGLYKIWEGVKTSANIYKPWAPWKLNYIWSLWKGSLNSGAPMRKLVEGIWDAKKITSSGVRFTVGCVSLTSGLYQTIPSDNDNIMEYVLASSHLPVVFEPLTVDGEQWVDGGIRHQIPILEALKERPDEIDVIITSPVAIERTLPIDPLTSLPKVALRASEILADQVYANDFFMVFKAIKHDNVKINLFVPSIQPNQDSMDFDQAIIQQAILLGYEETKKKLAEMAAEPTSSNAQ